MLPLYQQVKFADSGLSKWAKYLLSYHYPDGPLMQNTWFSIAKYHNDYQNWLDFGDAMLMFRKISFD